MKRMLGNATFKQYWTGFHYCKTPLNFNIPTQQVGDITPISHTWSPNPFSQETQGGYKTYPWSELESEAKYLGLPSFLNFLEKYRA